MNWHYGFCSRINKGISFFVSKHNVSGSTSQSTTFAPASKTAFELAINVISGTITSSPGPTSKLFRDANKPKVSYLLK